MASKINTKFLLILVVALCAGALIIGTAYYLNVRGSVTRNLKRGDEAYAAGDLRKAYDYYGRAIDKKPADADILHKLETTLLQIRPQTSGEANDRYAAYIVILAHSARYNAADPDAHLRLLRELYMSGRQSPYQETWERMISFADDMWRELPPENPQRIQAKTYRALGRFRLVTQSSQSQLDEAERDLREVLAANPKDDLAWSVLCMAQMQTIGRMKTEGRAADVIDGQLKKIDQTLKDAQTAVPDGPETSTVQLYRLILKPGAEYEVVNSDDIKRAADHVVAVVADDSDPGLVSTVADLLPGVPDDGFKRAAAFLQRYLKAHPDALDKRLRLAHQLYWSEDLDGAEQIANQVIDAEPLPTGFLSRLQAAMRQQAAGVIVNARARRWTLASAEDKPAHLASMEEARARLVSLVSDPANDPQVLRADGKIAYAKGDYSKAAQYFDRLARDPANVDNEVLLYSVDCLDRVGELGLAYERLKLVLNSSPNNVQWLESKVDMEVKMGRYDDAAQTLSMLPQVELTKPNIRDLVTFVNSKTTRETGPQVEENPVISLVSSAYAMMNRGEFDNARAALLPELQKSPDSLQLLQAMTQVEMQAGKSDKAREYLDRALKLQPNNRLFLRFDATLKTSDPVDATRQYNTAAFEDERERTVVMLFSMQSIAFQNEVQAKKLADSDPDRANKSRDIAARARAEIKSWEAKALQIMPDDPKFIEYSFLSAIADKDWPRAEQVVSRARALNSDQADGNLYQGRFLASQGNFQEAIRALEIATDRISYSAAAWRMLGMAYEGVGNSSQALRAFGQAYKCNPNDVDGARGYFRMLVKSGDTPHALAVVQSLHQLVPQDVQMRDLWLDFEAEYGDRFIALTRRREIYAENPNDAENAKRLARLFSDTEPTRDYILDENGQPLYNQQRWDRLTSEDKDAVIASAREQWNRESDEILNRLGADGKDDIKLASLRAALLRRRGQVSEGEEVLNKYIATHKDAPNAVELWVELARYQSQSSHFTQAIDSYTQAIAHQDAKKREADRELAMMYMQLGDYAHALEHLDLVLAVDPAEQIQKQKVECLVKLGRFDDAEKYLQELMKTRHGEHDLVTIMLAANIAEGRGNELLAKADSAGAERRFAEQREALARAEAFDPSSPTPRVFLAQSLLNEYRRTRRLTLLDDALQALARADKVRPGTNDVSMVRVAVLDEKGDKSAAIGELRRMLDANPDNIAARRALVQMHMDARDSDSAIRVIDGGIKVNPTLAAWQEAKGDVYHVINEHEKAFEAYSAACDISATQSLLRKIAETTFLMPKPDCKGLADRLSPRTEELNANPQLREFLAKALFCDNRHDDAYEQLRLAYKQRAQLIQEGKMKSAETAGWFQAVTYCFPMAGSTGQLDASRAEQFLMELCKNAPSVREMQGMARLWLLQGDPKAVRTIELLRQAILQCPVTEKAQMIDLNMDLANVLLVTTDFDGAVAAYRDVLSLDPNNVSALNNIAFVLAQELKDPAKALPYAEQAAQLAPQEASVLDTVGWVHFLAGNTDKAQQYLADGLKLDQENGMTHVHMAEVLLKTGNLDGAWKELDEAEKRRLDPISKKRIENMREEIGKKRTPGG